MFPTPTNNFAPASPFTFTSASGAPRLAGRQKVVEMSVCFIVLDALAPVEKAGEEEPQPAPEPLAPQSEDEPSNPSQENIPENFAIIPPRGCSGEIAALIITGGPSSRGMKARLQKAGGRPGRWSAQGFRSPRWSALSISTACRWAYTSWIF